MIFVIEFVKQLSGQQQEFISFNDFVRGKSRFRRRDKVGISLFSLNICLFDKLYNTIQYNTIQYNTIQYNTIQYNTIQYYLIFDDDKEIILLISSKSPMLWVLIRIASPRPF